MSLKKRSRSCREYTIAGCNRENCHLGEGRDPECMNQKIRIGIIFGGRSAEHEISLLSASSIINSTDAEKYESVLIGIDKIGVWFLCERSSIINADNPKRIALDTSGARRIIFAPGSGGVIASRETGEYIEHIDVAFPILHGPYGEDGTVQGLLRFANIPFVGAGVLGSAVGMDKDVMKRLLRDASIPIGRFVTVKEKQVPSFEEIAVELGLPFFVKPANLGSSISVSKVKDESEFLPAVREAFRYDTKILIEEYIKGREIECAVLGGDELAASILGEIIPSHEFYSYEAKYIDERGAELVIPAQLSDDTIKKIQVLAIKTFTTLECFGMARVDFFLTEHDEIFVNEINTLPGFTSHSMYPKLFEYGGVSCTELIDRLIQLALQRFEREQKLKTT